MFILINIEALSDDIQNLSKNEFHKLTFKLEFTIEGVPDSFTGTVYAGGEGELQLAHFNNPKGNKRKVITLKNKLAKGGFDQIKQTLFALAQGEDMSLPKQIETLKKRISGTPRA